MEGDSVLGVPRERMVAVVSVTFRPKYDLRTVLLLALTHEKDQLVTPQPAGPHR